MTSNDINKNGNNVLTIEMFNAGMSELRAEIRDVRYETRLNGAKIDWMQTSIYWGFAIMGIVIALVGLIVAILAIIPQFRRENSEAVYRDLSSRDIRDIRALIREEFSLLNSANRGN